MSDRIELPHRRESLIFDFIHYEGIDKREFHYRATIGFPDGIRAGRIGEIFLNNAIADSMVDTAASESATLASHLMQRGVTLDQVAAMLKRNEDGSPGSPLGTALQLAQRQRDDLVLLCTRTTPHVGKRERVKRAIVEDVRDAISAARATPFCEAAE